MYPFLVVAKVSFFLCLLHGFLLFLIFSIQLTRPDMCACECVKFYNYASRWKVGIVNQCKSGTTKIKAFQVDSCIKIVLGLPYMHSDGYKAYLLISSKSLVRSLAVFIAMDSTAPYNQNNVRARLAIRCLFKHDGVVNFNCDFKDQP